MDTSGAKVLESADDIQERRQQVLDRYRRFKELSMVRRQKLEDSYRFQFFRRDADELEKWIQEKLQIASDENYKDPTNLQVCLCDTFWKKPTPWEDNVFCTFRDEDCNVCQIFYCYS